MELQPFEMSRQPTSLENAVRRRQSVLTFRTLPGAFSVSYHDKNKVAFVSKEKIEVVQFLEDAKKGMGLVLSFHNRLIFVQ